MEKVIDTVLQGHCVSVMNTVLEPQTVNMVIYSPPYYRLRFYNTEYQIWGGNSSCTHDFSTYEDPIVKKAGGNPFWSCSIVGCGAWRGEIGWEHDPQSYVEHLMEVSDAVNRVLRDDGTYWVNISDTYQDKSLQLVPERFAIAMTDSGWFLRNVIIWHKPSVFGNPVRDRFIQDWEYVLFFSKTEKYWFDQDSVRLLPKMTRGDLDRMKMRKPKDNRYKGDTIAPGTILAGSRPLQEAYGSIKEIKGANRRCVWDIASAEAEKGHYAPFPPKLVELCIKAGCPPNGVVLDPFSGTGTTLGVARDLNRHFIGIELNPEYKAISALKSGASGSFKSMLKI